MDATVPVFINPTSDENLIALLCDVDNLDITKVEDTFQHDQLLGLALFNKIPIIPEEKGKVPLELFKKYS
jgi:hypothetical protein